MDIGMCAGGTCVCVCVVVLAGGWVGGREMGEGTEERTGEGKQSAATSGAATTPSGVGKLRYRLGGCVGEGATGKVYVGLNVQTGMYLWM